MLCNNYSKLTERICMFQDKFAIKRGNFNNVDEKHISFFKNLLGESGVLTNSEDLEGYNEYWFKHFKGNSIFFIKISFANTFVCMI